MSGPALASPELLRRVRALELRAREVAEGVLLGIHHAPHRGRSIEFAEHKEYSPGDDIRRIDWKVYGKSDRFYVKEYEDDTNITAVMLVDRSRSMDYLSRTARGPGGEALASKLDLARTMAAALSYLLLSQSDAVGLSVFGEDLADFLPPRARKAHFHEITTRLATLETAPGTDLATSLSSLAGRIKGRAMIVVFSDLLDEPESMVPAIKLLRKRRHELAFFHVLDPDEIEFPFDRLTQFVDMEGPTRLMIDPRAIAEQYRTYFSQFLAELRRELEGIGIDYRLARTDESAVSILTSWLAFRAATMRGRGSA